MTQSDFFAMLGAPLANIRWSWGSVRPDGTVFLRVWQDQIRRHDGLGFVRATNREAAEEWKEQTGPYKPGYSERLWQVEQIRQGAVCYLIMCEAEDVDARPRRVREFNQEEVFPGGRMLRLDDDWWIELLPPVPVRQVIPVQD